MMLAEGPNHRSYGGEGVLEYCREHDILVQAWAPLARGQLSGRSVSEEEEHVVSTAELVAKLAEKYSVSREAIVINWVLRHPAKIEPVIGSLDPDRIKNCVEALDFQLEREDWYKLFEKARGKRLP